MSDWAEGLSGAASGAAAGTAVMPGFGTVIGAALGGLSSLLGGRNANKASAKAAMQQMAWQEYMSNTAHQREVQDLRKAGLNPILSATGGKGASTPSGASYTATDVATPAVATAQAARRNIAEVEAIEQGTKTQKAEEDRKRTEMDVLVSQAALNSILYNESHRRQDKMAEEIFNLSQGNLLIRQQTQTEAARTQAERYHAEILGHSAKGARLEGAIDETKYGEIMRYLDRAVRSVTGGASAARNLGR